MPPRAAGIPAGGPASILDFGGVQRPVMESGLEPGDSHLEGGSGTDCSFQLALSLEGSPSPGVAVPGSIPRCPESRSIVIVFTQ